MLGGLLDAQLGVSPFVDLEFDHFLSVCVTRFGHCLHGLQETLQPALKEPAVGREVRELKLPSKGVA